MTTFEGRQGSALVVIDLQNDVVAEAHARDAVLANVLRLIERARRESVPVIWIQHHDDDVLRGTPGWELVPELTRSQGEPLLEKNHGDSFEGTDLGAVLAQLGVGHLVVVGAQTDFCIRSTLHGAFTRGYDVTLVGDAHTTDDSTALGAPPPDQLINHTNLYWAQQTAPGRSADVVPAAQVTFRR
ncbi:cysteine hydrolase family protein [Mycolicibacterium cosmeticum]|uniref:cysteine hydrolase family protein n=1 Tax=Mycolicibacterium cosmeticum TaxID=258533 RepID=UPI00320482EE